MGINKNVLSNEFKEFLRGIGYSVNTVNTFHGFINVFSEKQTIAVEKVKEKIVLSYLKIKLFKGDTSENKKGRIVSAFEHFFNDMHERGFNLDFDVVKYTEKKIPVHFTHQEIKLIFDSTLDIKVKVLFALMYLYGLKPNEVFHLAKDCYNKDKRTIEVTNLKGKPVMILDISVDLGKLIDAYILRFDRENWFFEGRNNKIYCDRGVELTFKKNLKKLKIDKSATLQTFRHTYAHHQSERGMDKNTLKEIMALKSSRSVNNYRQSTMVKIAGLGFIPNYAELLSIPAER